MTINDIWHTSRLLARHLQRRFWICSVSNISAIHFIIRGSAASLQMHPHHHQPSLSKGFLKNFLRRQLRRLPLVPTDPISAHLARPISSHRFEKASNSTKLSRRTSTIWWTPRNCSRGQAFRQPSLFKAQRTWWWMQSSQNGLIRSCKRMESKQSCISSMVLLMVSMLDSNMTTLPLCLFRKVWIFWHDT